MLVAGKIFLRPAKARKINSIKESLERGVVPRKKRQEFRHAGWFRESETEVTIMDEVAFVVFHGIDNDVEFFGDVADDGIWDFFFVLFNFGHKVSLSANNRLRIL
jgi:hypothetical protein